MWVRPPVLEMKRRAPPTTPTHTPAHHPGLGIRAFFMFCGAVFLVQDAAGGGSLKGCPRKLGASRPFSPALACGPFRPRHRACRKTCGRLGVAGPVLAGRPQKGKNAMSRQRARSFAVHFVFSTKYRRPFLTSEVAAFVRAAGAAVVAKFNGELLAAQYGPDNAHMHVVVWLPAHVAPAAFARDWKSRTSRCARRRFPWLQATRAFWSRGYWSRGIGNDADAVTEYVQNQLSRK